ncbi:protein kinase [Actinoplanes sp. NPDC051861]|uniref:serine/threonine protein kinase n=1 Tax=Actinoplanes sp. NPDC051861 TaxID=3155170 RepID=UPI003429E4C6
MPDAPPLLAARYRLGEPLGRGGMGEVWLARDETLQRDVAIKAIDQPPGAEDEAAARRTLREARAAARLNHPGVVQVYDVLQLDGRTWIVMEYVPSRSLRDVIAEEGPLEPERVARIGLDLALALRAAHRAGVQHRDVKPANVLLADDGRVLLTDFGIAAVDDDGVISRSDVVVGSPQFMAPERAQTGSGGAEADLWSLGATLFAAVEGHAPFERPSTMATLAALTTEEAPSPKRAGSLRPVIDGLLRKNPADRINAEDVEAQLRAVIGGRTSFVSRIPRQRKAAKPEHAPGTAAAGTAAGTGTAGAGTAAPETGAASEAVGAPGETAKAGPAAVPVTAPTTDASGAAARAGASGAAASAGTSGAEASAGLSRAEASGAAASAGTSGAAASAGTSGAARARAAGASDVAETRVAARSAAVAEDGAPGAGRNQRTILAGVAVLVVLIVAGVAWLVASRGDGKTPQAQTSPPVVTNGTATAAPSAGVSQGPDQAMPPPSTEPVATPTAGAGGRPELPAGWREYTDSTGFSLYVPSGWKRSRDGTMVYFRGDGRVLGIDQTDRPKSNPVADWRGQADYRVSRGDFPSYKEIKIESVKYFRKAADWEFTFTRNGTRQHVNNRGVVVADDKAYGFYWQTADSEWDAARPDLQLVFDSFRPAKS